MADRRKHKILVVDDEVHIQQILKFTLEREGYLVQIAGTGDRALAILRQFRPDLVLLDSLMPGESTVEMCKTIRSLEGFEDVLVFFLTQKGDPVARVEGIEAGANDYIVKPYSNDELLTRIHGALEYRERLQRTGRRRVDAPFVFVSYSHADCGFVDKLVSDLTASGHSLWIDRAEIQIGDSLIDRISRALQKVDYVLAIISRASVRSSWVRHELKLAMSREIEGGRVIVLPAIIEDIEVPEYLKDKYYADFRLGADYQSELEKIRRRLEPAQE
jgi:DNA-binding response OmpR family regulator